MRIFSSIFKKKPKEVVAQTYDAASTKVPSHIDWFQSDSSWCPCEYRMPEVFKKYVEEFPKLVDRTIESVDIKAPENEAFLDANVDAATYEALRELQIQRNAHYLSLTEIRVTKEAHLFQVCEHIKLIESKHIEEAEV